MAITNTNLRWFYSGGASNNIPSVSFGGAKSSFALATNLMNNLFDNVTGDEAAAGLVEYRMLYFQNTDSDAGGLMAPVVLWIVAQPTGDDTMEIGLAVAGKNGVETKPANDYTAPVNVSFSAPASKSGGIDFTTESIALPFIHNDYIGVWFKRTVPPGANTAASDGFQWRIEGDTV